jgi:hypothetical protein
LRPGQPRPLTPCRSPPERRCRRTALRAAASLARSPQRSRQGQPPGYRFLLPACATRGPASSAPPALTPATSPSPHPSVSLHHRQHGPATFYSLTHIIIGNAGNVNELACLTLRPALRRLAPSWSFCNWGGERVPQEQGARWSRAPPSCSPCSQRTGGSPSSLPPFSQRTGGKGPGDRGRPVP